MSHPDSPPVTGSPHLGRQVIKLFAVVALTSAVAVCEPADNAHTQAPVLHNEVAQPAQPAPPAPAPAPGISIARPRTLRNGRPAPGNVQGRSAPSIERR